MRASSRKLAAAVAARLQPVLPSGIQARSHDAHLGVFLDGTEVGGSDAAAIVEDEDDRTLQERTSAAVHATLSGIQDCIVEHLRKRWPLAAATNDLVLPVVESDGSLLQLSYGDRDTPGAIKLAPIDVSELVP